MTTELREAITRLRAGVHEGRYCGDQSDDIELVCDALEDLLVSEAHAVAELDKYVNSKPTKFDKVAYQREYMRKWRKAKS